MLAQSPAPEIQALQDALRTDDMDKAGQNLRAFWRQNPYRLYQLDHSGIRYFRWQMHQAQSSRQKKAIADSILALHENGIAHDPAGPERWLFERALLLSYTDQYLIQANAWTFALLESHAEISTTYPYELWANKSTEAYQAGFVPLKTIALQWMQVDERLLAEEIEGKLNGPDAAYARAHARQILRSSLPDCSQLTANFKDGIQAGNLDQESYLCFLALFGHGNCADKTWWEKAWNLVPPSQRPSWLYRLSGEMELAAGELDQALLSFELAAKRSEDRRLKANDFLQLANIYLSKGQFRHAREQLNAALELCPNWGEPYLRMIQVYQAGIKQCDLSEFDNKALNWLLLELAMKMGNADPNYASQAAQMSYEFLEKSPTRDEARFRGLSEGDTWPLKCWMSTTCRARFR